MVAAVDEGQFVDVHGVQDQLDADERQDHGQRVLEVDEAVHQPAQQEVQLAQSHQGKDVGSEDDEGALCEAEDGGDRVHGEEQVGHADGDEDDQHRGEDLLAVNFGAQLAAVELLGHRHDLADPRDERVFLVFLILALVLGLLPGGPEQEGAEDVEDPAELFDHDGAEHDEDAAQDERDDDAHHEHFLLVLTGYREAGHDDDEYKQVVDAEAVFRDPAGEELPAEFRAGEGEHRAGENQGEGDVEGNPQPGLLHGGFMRALEDQQQVDGEDDAEGDEGADLKPKRKFGHEETFRRVQRNGVSLSDRLNIRYCVPGTAWLPATPGKASVPCVLTIVALGILPYVRPTLP